MTGNWYELAIIAFILAGIGIAIWKGGAANPESTGSLGARLRHIDGEQKRIDSEVKAINRRMKDERAFLDRQFKELKEGQEAIEATIGEIRTSAAERHGELKGIKADLGRILDVIIPRGMK